MSASNSSLKCKACNKAITKTQEAKVCSLCTGQFHYQCLGITPENFSKESKQAKSHWKCPDCKGTEKRGDNSNTPIRQQQQCATDSINVGALDDLKAYFDQKLKEATSTILTHVQEQITLENKSVLKVIEGLQSSAQDMIKEMQVRAAEIENLTSQYVDIKRQIEPLPELLDEVKGFKERLNRCEQDMTHVKIEVNNTKVELESSNKTRSAEILEYPQLHEKLSQLASDVHTREQRERLNNVEIKGVPQKKNENLISIVTKLGQLIGQNIVPANINFITRARSDSNHKHIIVGFTGRITKENFVASSKSHKNLTAEDMGFTGVTSRIYINDHLTRQNKQLLSKTKRAAQEKCFQYVWVQNCKILVRKNDTSPFVHIQREEDLSKLN